MSDVAKALLALLFAGAILAPGAVAMPADGPVIPPARAFPIDGGYEIGDQDVQGFGGGRGHQGHDVFADCGTPVVAALPGRVRFTDTAGAGGNMVVIETTRKRASVYMHMATAPKVEPGDAVGAGERLGSVGKSGNAWDCHLHFELWSPPGWYRGAAYDPLPALKRWEG